MKNQFKERILKETDKSLLKVLNSKEDYQTSYFSAAVDELISRGYSEQVTPVLEDYQRNAKLNEAERVRIQRLPELYTDRAIIIFSTFFTAIGGAFMMAHNFNKMGSSKKSEEVLWFGFLYALPLAFLVDFVDSLLIRFVLQTLAFFGGLTLLLRFEKHYPKELESRVKPVKKILIRALLITAGIIFILILQAI
jgi:hypothetical protein